MKALFQTEDRWSSLVLRLMLGIVFFPHGAQHVLGWFGGHGFSGTMNFFTTQGHMPWIVAFLVVMGEFLGSMGLIVGFLTRIAAFGITCVMTGAIVLVHWKYGFFMNWFGKQSGEGFEYHLLAVAIGVAIMMTGAGKWSLDRVITEKLKG